VKRHPHPQSPAVEDIQRGGGAAVAPPSGESAPRAGASGQATRDRIVATAIDLMANVGTQRFSINAVIRDGGFSKGSFFFHFEGIDALCRACHERVRTSMLPLPDTAAYQDLRAYLEQIGAGALASGQARRWFALARFFEEFAATHPELGGRLFDLAELFRERFAHDLRQLSGREGERAGDIVAFLSSVLSAVAADRSAAADAAQAGRLWALAVDTALAALSEPERAPGAAHAGGSRRKPH
jgi:AcrR family transcriptional regulator